MATKTELELGDHLVSPRGAYSHHGIYVGGGRVVHYLGLSDGLSKEWIGESSLDEFACENDVYVAKHSFRIHDGDESVRRAFSRLYEDEYNIVFNNCEHFVNWCIFGIGVSHQVNMVAGHLYELAKYYTSRSNPMIRQTGSVFASVAANTATKMGTTEVAKSLMAQSAASISSASFGSTAAGLTAGLSTGGAMMGGLASGTAAVSSIAAAPVVAPVLAGVAACFAVKAAWDWFWD